MTVIPTCTSTACVCVCVDKFGTFKFTISDVHHSLAKQDKFNEMSYEIVSQSVTCNLLKTFAILLL